MRGLIFTHFLEMVEDHYSANMVDDIIDDAQLASGGAYTAVSKYDHKELHALGMALAHRTNQTISDILIEFGDYVFAPLYDKYKPLFKDKSGAMQFLLEIDSDIHKEMRKLYPDALLPNIECRMQGETLIMEYQSDRHFADLVHGLILGVGRYFNETLHIEMPSFDRGKAIFHVTKVA